MADTDLTPAEQRVAAALAAHGLASNVTMLADLATTAQMAADALGVAVGQIVKSLCFRGADSGTPYLLLVSGANRVHENACRTGSSEKSSNGPMPISSRPATGFSIGGVSPFGHTAAAGTYLDEDLFALESLWAAAGNPRSVFPHHAGRSRTHDRRQAHLRQSSH